ncbi:hypothetical protein V8C86DRAFT_3132271 [Haematococcus lacustris]
MTRIAEALSAAQQAELQALRGKNLELRRLLEKSSRELAVATHQLELARAELHETELARATADEYGQRLERSSGPSRASVLKASKLQSSLEFLEAENQALQADVQAKEAELRRMQQQVEQQGARLEQAALRAEAEVQELRRQVASLVEHQRQQEEVVQQQEEVVQQQALELQTIQVLREQVAGLEARLQQRARQLEDAEADKATLLDYVQEQQELGELRGEELRRARAATQAVGEEARQAQQRAQELQRLLEEQGGVLHASQQQCGELRQAAASARAAHSLVQRDLALLQAQGDATLRQAGQVAAELGRLHHRLQEVLRLAEGGQQQEAAAPPLQGSSPQGGGGGQQGGGPPPPGLTQVVRALALLAPPLELVAAQHQDMQHALAEQQQQAAARHQLSSQVSRLQSQLAAAEAGAAQQGQLLEAGRLAWQRLRCALQRVAAEPPLALVEGKEQQVAAAVEAALERLQAQAHQGADQVSSLGQRCAELQSRLAEALAALQASQEVAAQRTSPQAHQALGRRLQEVEAERAQLQQRLASLTSQQQAADRASQANVASASAQAAALADQVSALKAERSALQLQLEAGQPERVALLQQLEATQQTLQRTADELAHCKALKDAAVIRQGKPRHDMMGVSAPAPARSAASAMAPAVRVSTWESIESKAAAAPPPTPGANNRALQQLGFCSSEDEEDEEMAGRGVGAGGGSNSQGSRTNMPQTGTNVSTPLASQHEERRDQQPSINTRRLAQAGMVLLSNGTPANLAPLAPAGPLPIDSDTGTVTGAVHAKLKALSASYRQAKCGRV